MAANHDEVIHTLNNLIRTCKDRQYGYRTAADKTHNNEYKMLFHSYEQQSAQHAAELQMEVRRLGGDPAAEGSVAAWFRRGWLNIQTAVTGADESAIVAACEDGEDSAKSNYENALKEYLPEDAKTVVQRQFASIKEGHDRIRAMELATSS